MLLIAGVGAVTALYAALAALAQWDIKEMLAYSTISQVGYMFLAVGAGDIVGGLFHLVSHAFFKALLFLAAGFVIQALAEEHNIFRMGNLRRLPARGLLALSDRGRLPERLSAAGRLFQQGPHPAGHLYPSGCHLQDLLVYWPGGGLLDAAIYLPGLLRAFPERPGGRPAARSPAHPRIHGLGAVAPGGLALGDGLLNLPGGIGKNFLGHYLAAVPGARPDLGASLATEWAMGIISAAIVVVSLVLAYFLYGRRPAAEPLRQGFHELLFSGFYLDRLYQLIFVRPYQAWPNS